MRDSRVNQKFKAKQTPIAHKSTDSKIFNTYTAVDGLKTNNIEAISMTRSAKAVYLALKSILRLW